MASNRILTVFDVDDLRKRKTLELCHFLQEQKLIDSDGVYEKGSPRTGKWCSKPCRQVFSLSIIYTPRHFSPYTLQRK